MTAGDIHSFLTLSNQLQIHKNVIEIALNLKQGFKKVLDRLLIVTLTYLTQNFYLILFVLYNDPRNSLQATFRLRDYEVEQSSFTLIALF